MKIDIRGIRGCKIRSRKADTVRRNFGTKFATTLRRGQMQQTGAMRNVNMMK